MSLFRKIIKPISLAYVCTSLAGCLWKFSEGRSLWLDEAFVACNIRFRALPDLFGTLDYGQQFPRFYLAVIWILAHVIGYEAWVLRLLPLLFALAAVGLWSKLLWDEFADSAPLFQLTAVLYFVVNSVIYQYAADFKQYSGDLFWGAYICWLTKRARLKPPATTSGWIGIGLLASFPILLSNTYVLTLSASAAVLFFTAFTTGRFSLKNALIPAVIAGSFLFASWYFDLRFVPSGMTNYWREYFIQGAGVRDWTTDFIHATGRLIAAGVLERAQYLFVAMSLIGACLSWRLIFNGNENVPPAAPMGAILMAELLLLGALKKYPLDGERLCLFFYPFSVALIFRGFQSLAASDFKPARIASVALTAVLLSWILIRKTPELTKHIFIGRHWEDINPALKMLDPTLSRHVVYGTATNAQIKAHPHLPTAFVFTAHDDLDISQPLAKTKNDWLEGDFYYLMAKPNGDVDLLLTQLNAIRPHQRTTIAPHLFFFKRM